MWKLLRFVEDFQSANAVTIQDAGTVPPTNEFAEDFSGRAIYSLFDQFLGYDQNMLAPDLRDITAMLTFEASWVQRKCHKRQQTPLRHFNTSRQKHF